MKRFALFMIGSMMAGCFSSSSQAQPNFEYLTEFSAHSPMAIAADAKGGIYYTCFTFAGENLSKVYYVADPLSDNALETHQAIIDDDSSPAGRGWHGIAIDDTGAVYAALESGTASTCEVRKLTPAPDFQPDPDFGGGTIYDGQRHNGIAWMGRDASGVGYIAISTFTTCEIWDADMGGAYKIATGGNSYQRDCAFNPTTQEIYISSNRDRSGDGLTQQSVNVWKGGSLDNIDGYAEEIENGLIGEGAAKSTYGVNDQQIGYDAVHGYIMIAYRDSSDETLNNTVGFYDPANPQTVVFRLNAAESPNGSFVSPADMVTVATATETFLYVTDMSANRIIVFTTGQNSIGDYMVY